MTFIRTDSGEKVVASDQAALIKMDTTYLTKVSFTDFRTDIKVPMKERVQVGMLLYDSQDNGKNAGQLTETYWLQLN